MLLGASEKQSREVTLQKEEYFYRRGAGGGELPSEQWREKVEREKAEGGSRREERIKELAEWGMENAARQETEAEQDWSEDDEQDGAWEPGGEGDGEQKEGDESDEATQDLPIATTDEEILSGDEDLENDENAGENVLRVPHRHSTRAIVDSDEEDDNENARPPMSSFGRVLVADTSAVMAPPSGLADETEDDEDENDVANTTILPRALVSHRPSISVSSFEETEGTDKENNALLMFDRGEDKENTAVASQPLLPASPFGSQLRSGSLLLSPSGEVRSPLRELTHESATVDDDEDVFGYVGPGISGRSRSGSSLASRSSGAAREVTFDLDAHAAQPSSPGGVEMMSSDGPTTHKPTTGLNADVFKTPGPPSSALLQPAAIITPGANDAGFSQFFDETQAGGSGGIAAFGVPQQIDGFSQFETPAKVSQPYH